MTDPADYREETRLVDVDGAVLAGTLTHPADDGPWPVTLLLGGTFSDLRDADVDPRLFPGAPSVACTPSWRVAWRKPVSPPTVSTGGAPARARANSVRAAPGRWPTRAPSGNGSGRSTRAAGKRPCSVTAGAYVLCRVALEVGQPDAAVLQGALYRSIPELLEYNYRLVLDYMQTGEARTRWVQTHAPKAYQDALMLESTLAALESGARTVRVEIDDVTVERDLTPLAYDLDLPPEDQFRHLSAPTLVLHAGEDLNVPVEDAFNTVRALWTAGNREVELHIVPGANHSFQLDSDDYDIRVQEKITLHNFNRPFHPLYPGAVIDYLARNL